MADIISIKVLTVARGAVVVLVVGELLTVVVVLVDEVLTVLKVESGLI
jgi:hypothetical protein